MASESNDGLDRSKQLMSFFALLRFASTDEMNLLLVCSWQRGGTKGLQHEKKKDQTPLFLAIFTQSKKLSPFLLVSGSFVLGTKLADIELPSNLG